MTGSTRSPQNVGRPSLRIYPGKAATASDACHEVWPAIGEDFLEVVEAFPCKTGDGRRVFVEVDEDAEAAVFEFHQLG